MRFLLIATCWVLVSALFVPPPPKEGRVIFGVRIAMAGNSQMTTFIAVRYGPDGQLREKKIFAKDDFIRILSGFWPSSFNPNRINYFERENVFGGVYVNDTFKEKIPYCPAFDSLWKIRFSEFPFRGGNESGWSMGMYKPSSKQEKYLAERYKITHLDFDYISDTSFWVLLRDVSDSTWIMNYKYIE